MSPKKESLVVLMKNVLKCESCPLAKNVVAGVDPHVPGEGNVNSRLVFIGEAPGEQETTEKKPFVGRAGQIYKLLLNRIGLSRKDVYTTNTCKCRPPDNRTPTPSEVASCRSWLDQEIRIIKPTFLVAMGGTAFKRITGRESVSNAVGKVFDTDFGVPLYVMYHPGAPLYKPSLLGELNNQIDKLKELLKEEPV